MTDIAVRQELKSFIDLMPERNLYALRPLLTILVEEPLVVETDLTSEEHTLIAEGVRRFHEHPEDFVPLESIQF
jgi:hypothetical protein